MCVTEWVFFGHVFGQLFLLHFVRRGIRVIITVLLHNRKIINIIQLRVTHKASTGSTRALIKGPMEVSHDLDIEMGLS